MAKLKTTPNPNELRRSIEGYAAVLNFSKKIFFKEGPEFAALSKILIRFPGFDEMSEQDIVDFVIGETFAVAWTNTDSNPMSQELVEHFISAVNSIPRQYSLVVHLPAAPDWGTYRIDLGGGVALAADASTLEGVPLLQEQGINALQKAMLPERHSGHATFLEIQTRGYAGFSYTSRLFAEAFSRLKQLSFLLRNDGVFSQTSPSVAQTRALVTDRLSNRKIFPQLPHAIERLTMTIAPNPKALTLGLPKGEDPFGLFEVTGKELVASLEKHLASCRRFFSSEGSTHHDSVAAAMEWYFDSLTNDNQTLAYLSACIGLEALLHYSSTKDEMMSEMTKRISDRYAYMLADTKDDRIRLMQEMTSVLRQRGELVHARERRLTPGAFRLLESARRMLKECIAHELQPLIR
ncbi:MAG: hypothetical protein V4757_06785 [Pseudomonadota bacterium]